MDSKNIKINGFEQIKAFYSWVFNNQEKDIKPSHISLYMFLINQANRNNWVEWFKCPYDLGMHGSCIGSKTTYYSNLKDLSDFKLIQYREGINSFKAPLVNIIKLYKNEPLSEQVPVPLSEPVIEQLSEQLSVQLPEHIYKLLTSNIELLTSNINAVEKFINELKEKENKIKTWKTDFELYKSDLNIAIKEILTPEYIKERNTYHPNLNIEKSIEKACIDFWLTEAGWKNKKSSKSKSIDWKATFNNALSLKSNQVYKTSNNGQQSNTSSEAINRAANRQYAI